jgi:hypothetical protein
MLDSFSPDTFHIGGFPLITFDRRPFDSAKVSAFVLDWTKELTLVQFMDRDLCLLNGYEVLLNTTIKGHWEVPKTEFLARGALKRRLRPRLPKSVSIKSWQTVCETAGNEFALLVIERERIKRDACWIGKLVKTTRSSVTLRSIDPDVTWSSLDRFLYKDITKVSFGGGYETMLYELAPPLK